ncbi:MAG: Ku protein [Micromonosporaceae bacterium]
MRAIWKGAISFGLVSIGVKLYSATEEKDIRFHQVHRPDGGRVRYRRVCELDGEEVSYDDIAKGYDLGGGEIVILTDDDFSHLPLPTSRQIEVLEFVPAEQVDPILYARSYYLDADGNAAKPYVLLRDALEDSGRVAIVKVAIRQREQLAVLRVREDVLVMHTMLWPDEVRSAEFEFLDSDFSPRPQELSMAASLIDSMTADFEPSEYVDNYRAALQEVIDAKVAGREVVAPEPAEERPAAVDLMSALKASVERARQGRGGEPAEKPARKQAGAKAGGKKAAAKQPAKKAAKKTAKKTAARRKSA